MKHAKTEPPCAPISARLPIIVGLIAMVLLLGGFGFWAVTARISGAVIVPGQINLEQNHQVVQHLDGGVVAEIRVHDGSLVSRGDLLMRLDGAQLHSDLTLVEKQYDELLARIGRLEAERADQPRIVFAPALVAAAASDPEVAQQVEGQQTLFEARRLSLRISLDQLDEQARQLEAQIKGIEAQIASFRQQKALIGQELTAQKGLLDQGLAQASRVLALEREAVSLVGRIGALAAQRASAESRRAEIRINRLRLKSDRQETAETDLRDISFRVLELAERRQALRERIARLGLRAPVSGTVHAMAVTTPNAVIRPGDTVMYIIPRDRPLIVSARLPTIHIDEIHPDQPATLHFSAFATRTTPELTGRLNLISADVLQDDPATAPYYRLEIALDAEQLGKLGDRHLVPGMPVEVFLRTAAHRPITYLLKPFADYFTHAMRES